MLVARANVLTNIAKYIARPCGIAKSSLYNEASLELHSVNVIGQVQLWNYIRD